MKTVKNLSLAVLAVLAGCGGDDGSNGSNGIDGESAFNSLVSQTLLNVGHAQCLNGGVKIDSGVDDDSSGVLDTNEVDATEFVCSPTLTQTQGSALTATTHNLWYEQGQSVLAQAAINTQSLVNTKGKAKNIILFVGDGMGISTVTATRILAGQQLGKLGEEHQLSFDKFPFSGFAKTYNVDAQTPDSAGTMTAMMSGVKTDAGVIGVNEAISRGDCASVSGNELVTALELAEIAGKSTGIISTARITHATPAATYAKSAERNWEDNSDMPAAAVAAGCVDIASQLISFEDDMQSRFSGAKVNGIEVVMGGGRRHFLPKDAAFNSTDAASAIEGDRTDGRDLTAEWQAQYPAGSFVTDQAGFDAVDANTTPRLFGLFNESHMQYEVDRGNDIAGEPSLREMTNKAIDILDNNEQGFFLMVEAGRIDHGHHAGSAHGALTDAIAFADAVQAAVEATNPEETLIIVTADHSHVFTMAGYPKRGNPILGKVVSVGSTEPSLASDGMPYTTLGYTNGKGFRDLGAETNADASYSADAVTGRQDLSMVDTQSTGFHQEALVPTSSETHAGEDVGIYAQGPGAHLITGTNEQSVIFHVMDYAADLVVKAEQALN
ncbi:alkaline phosphatase [Colwellia sp. MB02u-18]|uniref:alkaline phosphatase n=1 Tax=unclassified Colwellia TaxID=196834 RepID=UPI0015F428E0|nr:MULTISPECIES: alkaline phosphatase [unclassified Colwellia]MBA6225929.1 alkaline phosphatase [Colwellia sp. MB3u-45]MBA6267165.1 alkaline phosphatase [Colwellia sp. MB3u-43]MBA6322089.1 alkaline phosphatase [Colwellia sp. MB02u-19]MBA6325319.1 alkaline phosphatase [Colwellia sp. MB02u-18]MBA6330338.1 alkaline phosphatase [Colwellia sp. MB02u-12]